MGAILFLLIELALIVVMFASLWKIAIKAGREGWEGIVPIYNTYILTLISGLPIMWFIFTFIPCLNIVAWIKINIELAKKFGKDATFAIAMIFIVGYIILAFSDAKYMAATPPVTPPAKQ